MRLTLLAFAAFALASCSPAPSGDAATAGTASAGTGGCGGKTMPITGVCDDANPALFLLTDQGLDTFARGCVWKTQELQIKDNEALVFRAQDCTGEMWDRTIYSWIGNYVKSRPEPVPADQATFAVQVFDVPAGQTAEQIAMSTLSNAPEDQRGRCITKPTTGAKVSGTAFELVPNDELLKEVREAHPDEAWEACGPNGVNNDTRQYWEGRKTHALFHMIGQDQPGWDPASFTFYRKGASGAWAKAG